MDAEVAEPYEMKNPTTLALLGECGVEDDSETSTINVLSESELLSGVTTSLTTGSWTTQAMLVPSVELGSAKMIMVAATGGRKRRLSTDVQLLRTQPVL